MKVTDVQNLRDIVLPPPATEWKFKSGRWKYFKNLRVIQLFLVIDKHERCVYEVDLDRCKDSHQVLDWIFQIRCKRWAKADCMKALLDAIYEVIDPQSNLCSWGMAPGAKPKLTLRRIKPAPARKDVQ